MSQPERSISIYRGDTYEHTVTFVWRDWDEDVAYVVGQHVAYGGHTYVALLESTGTTPGTDPLTWDDVAPVTTIDVSDRTFRSQVRRRRSLTSDLLLTFADERTGGRTGESPEPTEQRDHPPTAAGDAADCRRHDWRLVKGLDSAARFLKVVDSAGTTLVIPAYAES